MEDAKLPKGFVFIEGDEIKSKYEVLSKFVSQPEFRIVEFPSVSYLETFRKGANIIGEKVFHLTDKKGRELVLTPDSLGYIFSYYLSTNKISSLRLAFISPTFRYRNIPRRHFIQIGYSSINYSEQVEIEELAFLTNHLLKFIKQFTDAIITVKIVNPGLIIEILEQAKMAKLIDEHFYDSIRRGSFNNINDLINEITSSNYKDDLINIFNCNENKQLHLSMEYLEFQRSLKFKDLLDTVQTNFIFHFENIYSSEIMNSIGFIIEIEGKKVGDGGIYNVYGRNYDKRIHGVISVCTGVNTILRYMKKK